VERSERSANSQNVSSSFFGERNVSSFFPIFLHATIPAPIPREVSSALKLSCFPPLMVRVASQLPDGHRATKYPLASAVTSTGPCSVCHCSDFVAPLALPPCGTVALTSGALAVVGSCTGADLPQPMKMEVSAKINRGARVMACSWRSTRGQRTCAPFHQQGEADQSDRADRPRRTLEREAGHHRLSSSPSCRAR
jgi:hypothetical protein